jgi:hypothetical protein
MRCPSCAIELPDDARFCGGCGKRFDAAGVKTPLASQRVTPLGTPSASSFALTADDFARAFERMCAKAGLSPDDAPPPVDHASLRERATSLGIPLVDMEKALHRISVEKLPEEKRRAMGVVLDDEAAPPTRPLLVPVIIGLNVVAIVVGLMAFVWRSDAPAPVTLPPQPGEIDVAALNLVVDGLTRDAQACYQDLLKRRATATGEVVLAVRIGLDGKTETTSVKSTSLDDGATVACMLDHAQKASWPEAKIAPVDVEIPFLLTVTQKP